MNKENIPTADMSPVTTTDTDLVDWDSVPVRGKKNVSVFQAVMFRTCIREKK
jgi:hypothetical protein